MNKKSSLLLLIFVIALFTKAFTFAMINVSSFANDVNKISSIEAKIVRITGENEQLNYEIKNSSTDAFIEKHAREDLMLAKKGETVVYFKFENESKNNKTEENKNSNFFGKIFNNLLHLFQK